MPSRIVAFSKYLAYQVGGAEKSMINILANEYISGKSIGIVSFSEISNFGAKNKKFNFNNEWNKYFIRPKQELKRFPHLEYFINKSLVADFFNNYSKSAVLYTYSLYAPVAINSFQGKSKYYIRSETDLLIRNNYYKGYKKFLKTIYQYMELPIIKIYRKDLIKALNNSMVITNSNFTAELLFKMYNVNSTIEHPIIDTKNILIEYNQVKNTITNKGVVFVGDSIIKGQFIAKEIASSLSHMQFYFFSRLIKKEFKEGNITWLPWQNREADIYKYAKVVIVPSIWNESFGRLSREALVLNIPVLVSNLGGLPESVDYKKEYIIDNYKSIDEWVTRIKNIIA